MAAPALTPTPGRMLSLDVFRGATVASMILVNNAGDWNAIYTPFEHAEWHGWTFTDLVFPFFLWMVGVAITLSFKRRVERGDDRGRLLLHIARRSALIFGIGLLLALAPYFPFSTVRIPGVLQRIAVCYLIAATVFLFTGLRGRLLFTAACLAVYWVLMMWVPVPGGRAGVLDVDGNFAQYVDQLFLTGHMYARTKTWDPEGIVSTLPSIATTMFGIFTGMLLQRRETAPEKVSWLYFQGVLLLFGGLVLSTWMPINKKLWTDSFSLFMAGMASVVFASLYWLVDVQGWRRYTKWFAVYGTNALAMYVLSGAIARVLGLIKVPQGSEPVTLQQWLYTNLFAPLGPPPFSSLLYGIANVLACFAVAWWLYRKQILIRL